MALTSQRVLKVFQKILTCLAFSLALTSTVFKKGVLEQLSNTSCTVYVSINYFISDAANIAVTTKKMTGLDTTVSSMKGL